jgi:uncharacterized protein with GYD domain
MPTYVVLGRWTEQGIQRIKEGPKRAEAARAAVEKAGGKWLGFYVTMGRYDFVAVAEAPNDETVMQVLLTLGSQGNVRTETLKAFPEADAAKVIARIP